MYDKSPRTLDEAVLATLELESYLVPTGLSAAEVPPLQVVAGVCQFQDMMMEMLTKMMERLDRIESDCATPLRVAEYSNVRLQLIHGERIVLQGSLWCVTSVERRATSQKGVQFAILSHRETRNPRRERARVRGYSFTGLIRTLEQIYYKC